MKALSLHQPWASFMRDGDKEIETRSWGTSYRGDLLICSSKAPRANTAEAFDLLVKAGGTGVKADSPWMQDAYPLGVALCVVELVDCFRVIEPAKDLEGEHGGIVVMVDHGHDTPIASIEIPKKEFVLGNLFSDPPAWRWGWLTRNRRPLDKPVPVGGALGVFALPADIERSILSELGKEVSHA